MATCLIGLGSNLGDRLQNLTSALAALRDEPACKLLKHSSFRETAPVGGPANQRRYLNGAALLQCDLAPRQLLARLLSIEQQLGRVRTEHWGPRAIDLDLLLWDGTVIESPELIVPHPQLAERRFVLEPAAEIAPEMRHPTREKTVRALLDHLGPPQPHEVGLRIFTEPADMQRAVLELRRDGKRVGLVPTMGALHDGHLSLVHAARQHADLVAATIFVNPTQFAPHEDFSRYPRTLEADLDALSAAGCALVLAPAKEAVYPLGCTTFVEPPAVAAPLEGICRPGHFRGVTTVVLKLFGMVPADVACFGQKDYQQALVVRHMVADLNVPIEIVTCPIIREADGLAMSSRNRYLSPAERQQALAIWRSLQIAQQMVATGERDAATIAAAMRNELTQAGIQRIDYVALADPHSLAEKRTLDGPAVALVAAFVGQTRLIDNCLLQPET